LVGKKGRHVISIPKKKKGRGSKKRGHKCGGEKTPAISDRGRQATKDQKLPLDLKAKKPEIVGGRFLVCGEKER